MRASATCRLEAIVPRGEREVAGLGAVDLPGSRRESGDERSAGGGGHDGRESGGAGKCDGCDDDTVFRAISALPTAESWPDIGSQERERRERILWEISLRIMEDGPRRAAPSPERGRQFIPFAALKGYDEMLAQTERDVAAG